MKVKHGHIKKGKVSPEYRAWANARNRCVLKNGPQYHLYGGRGITMHPEWVNDFRLFLAHIGPKPPQTSLDRIDNNAGYVPGNVRWATPVEQYFNRRNVKYSLEDYRKFKNLKDKGMTMAEIGQKLGIPKPTIQWGLRRLKRFEDTGR